MSWKASLLLFIDIIITIFVCDVQSVQTVAIQQQLYSLKSRTHGLRLDTIKQLRGACIKRAAYLKGIQPSLNGILMLGGLVGGGHHVGAEHGAPGGLPLHALQQSLLPQVAE